MLFDVTFNVLNVKQINKIINRRETNQYCYYINNIFIYTLDTLKTLTQTRDIL
jgi:hypothetical protein